MENLNKLSFKNYKVNEDKIMIPMEEIVQEYDVPEHAKLYLFKIVYVHKYHSPTNTYICYLSPLESKGLPIVKAQIPLDLIYLHKIIPGFEYNRAIDDKENYIIKEKIFRLINKINQGYLNFYVISYGYLINKYKDDDANTKIPKGVQMYNFTSCGKKFLSDGNFQSYYIFNHKLEYLMKLVLLDKNPRLKYIKDKEILKSKAKLLAYEASFKKVPEGFLSEK